MVFLQKKNFHYLGSKLPQGLQQCIWFVTYNFRFFNVIYIYKLKIKSTSIDILWNGISLHQTFQEMILPPNISRNNSPTFINVTYKLQFISHQHCISFCWEHQHCISIPSNRILCYDRKVRIYHFFCAYFIKRHLSPNVQRNDTSMVEVL